MMTGPSEEAAFEQGNNILTPQMADELQEMMMSSDSDERSCPPPHIAARFYHSSRRKSSAASSRRNSMTSHHSSRSTRSARSSHGGPCSTHVAQHLRRASILESRKARLADRAAHAEQVRLRAAMAKAAPRASSNSMERALAAQQARERYLAQVAANCHSEVERAKRVAEDAREKKAADKLRKQDVMHERLAEAEKRKALYQQSQRRHRSSALPVVDERKPLANPRLPRNDDEVARIIQRAWTRYRRRKVLSDFVRLGLTPDRIRQSDFEDARGLISSDVVLTAATKVLKYCYVDSNTDFEVLPRIFLTAFMIVGQPVAILGSEGPQEEDLVDQSKSLLSKFERLRLSLEASTQTSGILPTIPIFSSSLSRFHEAFKAWKSHDMTVLLSTMLKQFAELDAIWQTVKGSASKQVTDDYREGIQHNQTILLVRLKRMLGPDEAMRRVKLAIREGRKERSKKLRAAATSKSASVRINRSWHPIEHASESSKPSHSMANNASTTVRQTASLLPDNRTVMHELALNREYRVDAEPTSLRRQEIMQSVSQTINDVLQSGLGDMWITAFAENIRERLLGLVTPGKALHTMITEALDVEMISRQVKVGTFSYPQFFAFVTSILPKICAPVRDAEVKVLAEDNSEDYVTRLARLYYVIDLLCLDKANFTLQINAPMMLEQAAAYEERSFSEVIQSASPAKTLRWWSQARSKLQEDLARRPDNARQGSPSGISAEKIYTQGLVDLSIAVTPIQDVEVPETLDLDFKRLDQTRSSILRIIVTASTLLTVKNLLKRDVRSSWQSEAQRMRDIPFTSSPAAFISPLESAHTLPPLTKAQITGTIERILADARVGQATHPVMKVLLQKLKGHIFARLSASSAEERNRVKATANDVLAGMGLVEFTDQVDGIVEDLKRIGEVDREAHGRWYDEVARIAEREVAR